MPSRRVSVPSICPGMVCACGVRGDANITRSRAPGPSWRRPQSAQPPARAPLTVFFCQHYSGVVPHAADVPHPNHAWMLPLTAVTSTAAAAAMLDPTRFAILEGLKAPGSAASVAAQLGAPRQRIWYHIRELERAGLVAPVSERAHGGLIERLVQASAAGYVVAPQALGPVAADPATVVDHSSNGYQLAVAARIIRGLAELRARGPNEEGGSNAHARHASARRLRRCAARIRDGAGECRRQRCREIPR